jgi:hypothetical protein
MDGWIFFLIINYACGHKKGYLEIHHTKQQLEVVGSKYDGEV